MLVVEQLTSEVLVHSVVPPDSLPHVPGQDYEFRTLGTSKRQPVHKNFPKGSYKIAIINMSIYIFISDCAFIQELFSNRLHLYKECSDLFHTPVTCLVQLQSTLLVTQHLHWWSRRSLLGSL